MITLTLTREDLASTQTYDAFVKLMSTLSVELVKPKKKHSKTQRLARPKKTYDHIEISEDISEEFGKVLRSKKALVVLQTIKRHRSVSKIKLLEDTRSILGNDFNLRNLNGVLVFLQRLARLQKLVLPYNSYTNDEGAISFSWL